MDPSRRRLIRLLIRVAAYVIAVWLLFQARSSVDWRHLFSRTRTRGAMPGHLTLSGGDLAPDLVRRMLDQYRHDYPELEVRWLPGGTREALEALVNLKSDVAFIARPITPEEQRLFREATGDSALSFPVALGGLVLMRSRSSPLESLGVVELRELVETGRSSLLDRLYAPDPNTGLWKAFLESLGSPRSDTTFSAGVVFLENELAELEALKSDDRAVSLISSLKVSEDSTEVSWAPIAVRHDSGGCAAAPTYENIGTGKYPLYHYLYVACRPGGGAQGDKFVTHLVSSRGQRQIERAGYLPARQVLREVVLTPKPRGGSR